MIEKLFMIEFFHCFVYPGLEKVCPIFFFCRSKMRARSQFQPRTYTGHFCCTHCKEYFPLHERFSRGKDRGHGVCIYCAAREKENIRNKNKKK
jgi:hypothetical protein